MHACNLADRIIKGKDRHGSHILGVTPNLKTWAYIH